MSGWVLGEAGGWEASIGSHPLYFVNLKKKRAASEQTSTTAVDGKKKQE